MTKDDLEILQHPGNWPKWPLMPMKRYDPKGGMPQCATIVAWEGYETTLIIDEGEILWGTKTLGKSFKEILAMFKTQKYETTAAMLADGWECD